MTKFQLFQKLCGELLVREFGFEVEEVAEMSHPAVVLRDYCEESHAAWRKARRQMQIA